MGADRPHVVHLPRPGLVAINAGSKRSHRADVDTGTTFVAFQMIPVRRGDLTDYAAVDNAQRSDAITFTADTNTAIAKNAAGRVEEYDRRELLFIDVILEFGKAAFARAVPENHVLQLTFAALIANRAIQRVI